ncbi:RICIN domain-containing protein [Micromonospora sp. M12]
MRCQPPPQGHPSRSATPTAECVSSRRPATSLSARSWYSNPATATPNNNGTPSRWRDRYRLVNQSTLGCMDAHGPYTNGTPVDTWPCAGISNQVWTASHPLPHSGVFTLKAGGKCLDVAGGSHAAGAALQIWTCNGTPAQGFYTPR